MEMSGQLHASAALTPRREHPATHWIGKCLYIPNVMPVHVLRGSNDLRKTETQANEPSVAELGSFSGSLRY
jgi:hypothetical protein